MLNDENKKQFKLALGTFPTGVTVISAEHKKKFYGFTANSFQSVSINPPLISFCIDNDSGILEIFNNSNYFAISILSYNQSAISRHFASRGIDKFAIHDWANKSVSITNHAQNLSDPKVIKYHIGDISNAPIITDAICFIECKKYDSMICGDHTIFIGEVMKSEINHNKKPLIYFARSYFSI